MSSSRGRVKKMNRYLTAYSKTYESKLKKLHYFATRRNPGNQLIWSIQKLNESETNNLDDPGSISNIRARRR